MRQSLSTIEKVIWKENKHGRNYTSLPPCDDIPSEAIAELSNNGFVCKKEPADSGNSTSWTISW